MQPEMQPRRRVRLRPGESGWRAACQRPPARSQRPISGYNERRCGMAFLTKIKVIRYVDGDGRRCSSKTPGAKKVEEESAKWYGCYRDKRKKLVRVPLSTDKQAAQSLLGKLLKNTERGKAGLTDPFDAHLNRPVLDHLEEYLPVMRERVTNDVYRVETERIIRKIIDVTGMKLLADLTPERVEDYLLNLTVAPTTKKKRHSAMNGFAVWLFKRKRIPQQIMLTVAVPSGTVKTKFRSLSLEELQRPWWWPPSGRCGMSHDPHGFEARSTSSEGPRRGAGRLSERGPRSAAALQDGDANRAASSRTGTTAGLAP